MMTSIVEEVKYKRYAVVVAPRKEETRSASELLHNLVHLIRRQFATVALEVDLTPPQMGVLIALDDGLSMSSLATMMQCDASNITWMTDRLEERHLVERHADANDRRVKRLVLTEEGRRLRKQIDRRIARIPNIERLTPDEQLTFAKLLARVLGDV